MASSNRPCVLFVHSKHGLPFGLDAEVLAADLDVVYGIDVHFRMTTSDAMRVVRDEGVRLKGIVQNMQRSQTDSGMVLMEEVNRHYPHTRRHLPFFIASQGFFEGQQQGLRRRVEQMAYLAQADPTTDAGRVELYRWIVDHCFAIEKTVYFLRHGQALHNVSNDFTLHDPVLTPRGEAQASMVNSFDFAHTYGVRLTMDAIVCSPLKRTIQTALRAFASNKTPIVLHQDIQETGDKVLCDIGSDKEPLQEWLDTVEGSSRISLSPLDYNWHGVDTSYEQHEWRKEGLYEKTRVPERVSQFIGWLRRRPEHTLGVVAHDGVFNAFFGLKRGHDKKRDRKCEASCFPRLTLNFDNCELRGLWLTKSGEWKQFHAFPALRSKLETLNDDGSIGVKSVLQSASCIRVDQDDDSMFSGTTVHVLDKTLLLSSTQSETELEPLFSGASWAGTILWDAAVLAAEHLEKRRDELLCNRTVLELGCGIGVPGMAAAILGAKRVYLTEQPQLVEIIDKNVEANAAQFPIEEGTATHNVHVQELSWGDGAADAFLADSGGMCNIFPCTPKIHYWHFVLPPNRPCIHTTHRQ
jgi:broad specificity phosphatase PhoE